MMTTPVPMLLSETQENEKQRITLEYCENCSCEYCERTDWTGSCTRCLGQCCQSSDGDHDDQQSRKGKRPKKGLPPPTPLKRAKKTSSANSSQKLKAAAAAQGLTILTIGTDLDVPDTPCLLSGEEYPVQVCHVVPRALPSDLAVKLERAWKYEYGTFNLHTNTNLIHLSPTLHYCFDDAAFAFLPDSDGLVWCRNFSPLETLEKSKKKVSRESMFKYTLLCLKRRDFPIVRDGVIHRAPTSEFPIITSHMLPHFALYNLGEKIRKLYDDSWEKEMTFFEPDEFVLAQLRNAMEIYDGWMKEPITSEKAGSRSRSLGHPGPSAGPGSHSSSRQSHHSRSGPQTRSQTASRKGSPSGRDDMQDDTLSPRDSVSCIEGDSDEESGDEDNEEAEETLSAFQKSVEVWRNGVHPGLLHAHANTVSEAIAIERASSGNSNDSNTLVTSSGGDGKVSDAPVMQGQHTSEKLSSLPFDTIDPSFSISTAP